MGCIFLGPPMDYRACKSNGFMGLSKDLVGSRDGRKPSVVNGLYLGAGVACSSTTGP